MELMDVQKFAPTYKIYETFVGMTDLNLKLNGFQQAYSRIDFENPSEDALKRAKELQRMAEDYREKLEGVNY
jgi:ppGpp synthetase/RelA/SpoT-type nucleotidyltranferase